MTRLGHGIAEAVADLWVTRRRPLLVVGSIACVALGLVTFLPEGPVSVPADGGQPLRPGLSDSIEARKQAAPKDDERVGGEQPAAPLEPYKLDPPLLIYGAASFGPEGGTPTHLVGVETPGFGAVCRDDEGNLWACGLQGRAALNNLIRQKTVTCMPEAVSDTKVEARCQVEGRDLAALLVERGFARVAKGGSSEAQERARAARLGLWNGAWTFRP